MVKLPYREVDRGMGQLMDRPEIAYVLASGFEFSQDRLLGSQEMTYFRLLKPSFPVQHSGSLSGPYTRLLKLIFSLNIHFNFY
jgi:hypothetical protein